LTVHVHIHTHMHKPDQFSLNSQTPFWRPILMSQLFIYPTNGVLASEFLTKIWFFLETYKIFH
jgi:hypothetical protein